MSENDDNQKLKLILEQTDQESREKDHFIMNFQIEIEKLKKEIEELKRQLEIESSETHDKTQEAAHYNWLDDQNEILKLENATLKKDIEELKMLFEIVEFYQKYADCKSKGYFACTCYYCKNETDIKLKLRQLKPYLWRY
jgi:hypothetical protein